VKRSAFPTRDPLAYAFFGRNWMSDDGYCLTLLLLPAPTLRRRNEEGMMMLVGLGLRVRFLSPWGRSRDLFRMVHRYSEPFGWRWPLAFDLHSDAREIAYRRAEAAGHRFPERREPAPAMIYPPDERIPF
jgi:hypothetical protein